MSTALIRMVASLGLISEKQLEEFMRWGLVDRRMVLAKLDDTLSPEAQIGAAMDMVGIERRETDLAVLGEYKKTKKSGSLFAFMDDVMHPAVPTFYGKTRGGEYIFPWGSKGFEDILVNGRTYLETETHRVYFMDSRPVYFDDLQSFVVCKSGSEEARDGDD